MAPVKKAPVKKTAVKATVLKKPSAKKVDAEPIATGSGRKLVIVESPSKAKTITKYLGKGYKVMASVGHIRDLPTKEAVEVGGKKVPVIDQSKCTRCGSCYKVCRFGAIVRD